MYFIDEIQHPREWLGETLELRKYPNAKLAREVGISASQLGHILSGKNPMPILVLDGACKILGLSDKETRILRARNDVHTTFNELEKQTDRHAKKYREEKIDGLLLRIQELLTDVAIALYKQSAFLGEERQLSRLRGFLSDAALFTKLLVNSYMYDPKTLLRPDNAHFHLRQPLSSYVGAIIKAANQGSHEQLVDLRDQMVGSFRDLAEGAYDETSDKAYAQQHAVHILGRYGAEQDQEFIEHYLKSDDILAQRMAYFGMSLGGNDAADEKLFELITTDPHFLQAVISFDATHYGDANFVDNKWLPSDVEDLDITISNSIAYITQEIHSENLNLNFIKLNEFLRSFGPPIFNSRHRKALQTVLATMRQSPPSSGPREVFFTSFSTMLDIDST